MTCSDILDQPPAVALGHMSTGLHTCLLNAAGLFPTVRSLVASTEDDVLTVRGLGRLSLLELKDRLAHHGLELKKSPWRDNTMMGRIASLEGRVAALEGKTAT
jgi:hypothetical protein